MKEFIEKLIGRLEERRNLHTELSNSDKLTDDEKTIQERHAGCFQKSIQIVNQLAEEYKDKTDDEWQIIYNKVCNLEKKYANDGNIESVNDCVKLENLLQYFKEELQAEEYNNGFCEWKVEDEEGFSNCRFTYQEIISDEVKGFAYCPYCGKKIKVV